MDIQTAAVHTCRNTASILKSTTRISSPAVRYCKSAPNLRLKPLKRNSRHFSMASSVRIAVVGDVHDDWDLEEDRKALQYLKSEVEFLVSLPLFLGELASGDFGNENVDLVKSIADLEITKAVILGNHDAWNTSQFSGKEKDGVQLQLECCLKTHFNTNTKAFFLPVPPARHMNPVHRHMTPSELGSLGLRHGAMCGTQMASWVSRGVW
nr:uncharacterized protein LOC109191796 [Ipomoea trifida]